MTDNVFWENSLLNMQAEVDDEGYLHWPTGVISENYNSLNNCSICPASHMAIISVTGPDAAKFLQGQTTCNIEDLSVQQALKGAFCNPKGRIFASFLIVKQSEERYLLRLHQSLAEQTIERLSKYIVFSKAKMFIEKQLYVFGIFGNASKYFGENTLIPLSVPTESLINVSSADCGSIITHSDTVAECILDQDTAKRLLQCETLVPSAAWELAYIQMGIADVAQKTSEEFLPENLNYDITGAVSYTKGCYTGQEIIARMHYLSEAKRRLYRLAITGEAPPSNAVISNANGEKKVGMIVNSVTTSDGNSQALAILKVNLDSAEQLIIQETGQKLSLESLPYAIT